MARAPVKYVTVGKLVSGKPAIVRVEIAQPLLLAEGLVKILTGFDMAARRIQCKGGSSLSAGTHSDGVAVDYRVWGMDKAARWAVVAIYRECGFSASWSRDWAGNFHLHCAGDLGATWTRAAYQVTAVRPPHRRDGLGKGGMAGRDPHPAPSAWRTCQQGAAWATSQLLAHKRPGLPSTGGTPTVTIPTPSKEDTLSASEVAAIKAHITAEAQETRRVVVEQTVAIVTGGFNRDIRNGMAADVARLVATNGFARPVIEQNGESAARQTAALIDAKITALAAVRQDIKAGGVTDTDLTKIEAIFRKTLEDNPITIGGKK